MSEHVFLFLGPFAPEPRRIVEDERRVFRASDGERLRRADVDDLVAAVRIEMIVGQLPPGGGGEPMPVANDNRQTKPVAEPKRRAKKVPDFAAVGL